MIRRVLFYGDSNTWGYRPGGERLPANRRWTTMVTRRALNVFPLADGLNGRTTAWESPLVPRELLGGATFGEILEDRAPIHCAAIMLGTNDVCPPLRLAADEVAENVRRMVGEVRLRLPSAEVLVVSPPPLGPSAVFELGAREAPDLAAPLRRVAEEEDAMFFDGGVVVPAMDARDGIHLTEVGHLRLGVALGSFLRSRWGL